MIYLFICISFTCTTESYLFECINLSQNFWSIIQHPNEIESHKSKWFYYKYTNKWTQCKHYLGRKCYPQFFFVKAICRGTGSYLLRTNKRVGGIKMLDIHSASAGNIRLPYMCIFLAIELIFVIFVHFIYCSFDA